MSVVKSKMEQSMSLNKTLDVFEDIAYEPKTGNKLKILKENRDKFLVKDVVLYALDFTKKYGIMKFPPENYSLKKDSNPEKLFSYLDKLSRKRGTSQVEVQKLASLCSSESEIELVRRIVNKDLRCGINLKTACKVFSDLPTKDIMLC